MRTGPSAQAEAVHDDPRESILDERPADGLEEGGFLHRSLRSFVSAGHGRRGGEGNTIRTRKPQGRVCGSTPGAGAASSDRPATTERLAELLHDAADSGLSC